MEAPDPAIKELIQNGIKEIWTAGILSDITLVADGTEFSAHRVVLAAGSPFFMAMFGGAWTEASCTESVSLKGVPATGLRHLLEYIYTGLMHFYPEDVIDVFYAADHLQILPAIQICARFMEKHIDIDNCVDVLNLAQMHSLESLENAACDFTRKNFQKVLQCKLHCRLKLSDLLYFIDGGDEGEDIVVLDSEMTVFSAVLEWLRFDTEKRIRYVEQVMEAVRFKLLSPSELKNIVKNVPFMTSNSACQKLVADALNYHQKPQHQRVLHSESNQVRSRESILVTSQVQLPHIEAWLLNPHHATLQDPKEAEWLALPDFPSFDFELYEDLEQFALLETNGFLIAVMIKPCVVDVFDVRPKLSAFIFDPRFFSWSESAKEEVSLGSKINAAVVCKENLFVFVSQQNDSPSEILRYSFQAGTWDHYDVMQSAFLTYSVCTYDRHIYVFGFATSNSSVCTLSYDPDDQSWTSKADGPSYLSLEKSRASVFGQQILHSGIEDGSLSFDMYRPDEDTWTTLWVNGGFSHLSATSEQIMAGDNLLFIDDNDINPKTIEMTLGRKFRHMGRKFVAHQPLPLRMRKGSLIAALRIPGNRQSAREK